MLRRLLHVVVFLLASWALPACEPAACCDEDADCGAGLGCFDGRCSYPCSNDDECAPAEICARPTGGRAPGVCVAPGEDVDECRERQAPPRQDGGPGHDAGGPDRDGGEPDLPDAGRRDAGSSDAGFLDAGSSDAGSLDAGSLDAGSFDAGSFDAGSLDAGSLDAGSFDAGSVDAGAFDAGPTGCVDDAFEPNDSQQQATSVELPAFVEAQMCAPDPDFFQVSPANRTELTVDLVDQPFVGLVVTVLRRVDFTILAVISSASGPTVVDLGDQPTGPLLFIVGGVQDAAYTLSIE